jgi:hypothetical protein
MRTIMNRIRSSWLLVFAVALGGGGACEPLPANSGQFWNDRGDASFVLGGSPGTGGSVDPTGTGGSIGPLGSAGDTGSTGTAGTGDDTGTAGAAGGDAGNAGTTGSGGDIGTAGAGGATGRGGSSGSGGASARGGTTGSGGTNSTGGRGGTTGTGGRGGSGGTTGAAGTGAAGTTGTAGTSGVLTGTVMISVTTKAPGGRYQPDNVGAIWIADSSTRFVKSLYVWGTQRRGELTRWTSATSAAGLSNNLVDAVTAATMRSHGLRTATWNGTDTKKALVADGAYKVCFEVEDGAQQYQCVDFTKSRSAQTVTPADTAGFTMRKIAYTP